MWIKIWSNVYDVVLTITKTNEKYFGHKQNKLNNNTIYSFL